MKGSCPVELLFSSDCWSILQDVIAHTFLEMREPFKKDEKPATTDVHLGTCMFTCSRRLLDIVQNRLQCGLALLQRRHVKPNSTLLPPVDTHQTPASLPSLYLDVPTFCIWGSGTEVGKTLISAGLLAATLRANVCSPPITMRSSCS
jgi:hypothetical protein